MNPAKLRHRITFQREQETVDKDGFSSVSYVDVITVWAQAKTVSGREYHQAAATQNERATRWIIRYRRDLSEDMRVLFEGKVFDIEAILPDDELKKTLTIVCKEVI
ncbi:phage head closure protein [Metabacillus litoralis]|uniref:phage head closure protein n=1 Tax=Metabacillus litoralis TaxID=152268 RepID=UPI00203B67F8|nr:phage head closure protein [Metabacillus litoralis]MCM3411231.1 phage head closure protein [Metabacillus litoralis]